MFKINRRSQDNQTRVGNEFLDWEWRTAGQNRGNWQNVTGGTNSINFADGVLGENIIEVRRKAGTYFLFSGGKSCARVGLGGELLGGNQ